MAETESDSRNGAVGYIVSAWPRLSETFILNEVLGVERLGTPLRIFSIKEPKPAPVHTKTRQVRAHLTSFAHALHWWCAIGPGVRLLSRHPVRFFRAWREAIQYRHVNGGKRFIQALCLADELAREPVAHLHAHFANAPAVVAMLVSELTGIPYTFTAHAKDIYVKTPLELLRAEVRSARAVITCTDYNLRFLVERVAPAYSFKLHRVYHGLDLTEFNFRPPRERREDPPVILSVARLVEKKGLTELISAARLLKDRGRPFKIEIIGDGTLRRRLEAQVIEQGLQDRVELLGALPHERVREAYARASVFALPCVVAANGDRDGIPNVLLEAMASGVPVVSTPVSGIPEAIESERDGLLVEPGSAESLAGAMDRLLSDKSLCERLARAARMKVEASYSVDRNCTQLLQLFRNGTSQEVPEASPQAAAEISPVEYRG